MRDEQERPMVSVVMVAYNGVDVIDEAIKGVVGQRAPFNFELIVADDCSTDGTYEKALEWQRQCPEIVRVHRNDHNLGIQRNYFEALKLCRGRYVAMCDGDDYWCCRSKLARQVAYMESHPECSITFHRVINYYCADGSMSLSNGGQRTETTIADLARSNYITNLSVMYRVGDIDLTSLPEWILDTRLVDYPLHMIFASRGSIHYFRRPMGVYRISSTSAWSNARRRAQLEMALRVRKNLMAFFADRPEVTEGLQIASDNIVRAIEACDAPGAATTPSSSAHRRILKSLRRALSRLIPRPRP